MTFVTKFDEVKLPERFIYQEIFPLCESQCIEFKQHFNPGQYARSYYQTICGFLNASGGYLLFGIRDRDRSIQGDKMTNKDIDYFLQFVDNLTNVIRHQPGEGTELRSTSPFAGSTQVSHLFKARVEEVAKSYYVCIISCCPEPNRKYCLSDMSIYIRNNAMTQKIKSIDPFYNRQMVSKMLAEKEVEYNKILTHTKKEHQRQLEETTIEISNILYDVYRSQEEQPFIVSNDHRVGLIVFFIVICSLLYVANY